MRFHDAFARDLFDEVVRHRRHRRVAVKPGVVFHLDDAVFQKFLFVFVKVQTFVEVAARRDKVHRGKSSRNARAFRVVFDKVDCGVQASVHGTVAFANIFYFGFDLFFGGFDNDVDKFVDALVFRGRYRHDGTAHHIRHFLNIDGAAVSAHFVHHIQRNDHRNIHCHKLRREIKISLDRGGVDNVYYAVGFFVQNKVARDDFFRRVRAQRINARKIDDNAVVVLLHNAQL